MMRVWANEWTWRIQLNYRTGPRESRNRIVTYLRHFFTCSQPSLALFFRRSLFRLCPGLAQLTDDLDVGLFLRKVSRRVLDVVPGFESESPLSQR
jgi:hypothetical protein